MLFIHEALLDDVSAITDGLHKSETPVANPFAIRCPTIYREPKAV